MPALKDGQVLVRNLYMSLDPALRPQMSIRTYVAPVPVGGTMRANTIGEVAVPAGKLQKGDLVMGNGGWQEYWAASPKELVPVQIPAGVPLNAALGLYGMTGLTAYFGLLRVGEPKAGETVLVSGAVGATGNVVCQIAKLLGCRVVGIAGGAEKCRVLTEELGCDAAIDYKSTKDESALAKAIGSACPKGVDVYFDNIGGWQLNAALRRMRLFGRVVMCGAISGYDKIGSSEATGPGIPSQVVASIVSSRLRLQGFIITDFMADFPKALADIATWLKDGRLKNLETVVDGLPKAAAAFRGLFEGSNKGKLTVKIADPVSGASKL
eukprot:NODE_11478_length_1284_cov_5.133967.p1 GENE.NODE_11478_length_1284_cov_5.133967~~NODE_11478_length_1284_cov_5.133967.p1  ORF type:complete len:347 (-),score=100.10 NODE_11478_length_1284_cov_5.133967:244-1215(-)